MGWLDRVGRELSKGVGAIGGAVGDIFGGIVERAPDILSEMIIGRSGGGWPGTPGTAPGPVGYPFPGFPSPSQAPGPFIPPRVLAPGFTPAERSIMPVLPGGAIVQGGSFRPVLGGPAGIALGVGSALLGEGIGSLFGNGNGVGSAAFRQTTGGVRANRSFHLPHPVTGEDVFFGSLGRPLLFTRDMSAAKKVDRLARRARRSRRGR